MNRLPGYVATDHTLRVPLDHADPGGAAIDLFAREIVAPDKVADDLPWLVFLQGGPGAPAPRPLGVANWLPRALRTHRVVMLDQRGTGRSSPITARTVEGMGPEALAAYLRLFRADSIVEDAEIVRARLTGGAPWESLGQSYGGFITLAYLSMHPEGLSACYVTGGVPSLTRTADDVYARTFDTCAAKNARFYRRYPGDAAVVREIADLLESDDVRLPDGDRLTPHRFRLLGNAFGMSDGFEKVHWMLECARDGRGLTDAFRYAAMAETGFVDTPIWALQEFTYGGPGHVTAWAAERTYAKDPRFAADSDPLLFTGEMMFPWMFREIGALRPFAEAAEILAAYDSWPALFEPDRLASNEVPLVAAVYADDMYVPSDLQMESLDAIGNARGWLTNEYEHDGLRTEPRVLDHLMAMAAGHC
jgi:pimeloyl-ACP methyl ester carboxylesterase